MSNQPQPQVNAPYGYYPTQSPGVVNQPAQPNKKTLINREMDRVVPRAGGSAWGSVQWKPVLQFIGQNVNERVFVLSRRHWISNLGWINRNIVYALIPFIVIAIIDFFKIPIPQLSFRINFIILLAYYSLIFTNVLRFFFDWYFDTYIVTNERILDFRFKPFASYEVEEIFLENIQSVKQNTPGILASIFNYGNISVSTEAKEEAFLYLYISNPTKIRDIISDLAKIVRNFRNAPD